MSDSGRGRSLRGIHLRLFRAERLTIGEEWNAANVQSRFWRFYANDTDGASLLLDDGAYSLRGGSLYLVPPFVRFSCVNTHVLDHFYVHFDVLGPPPPALRGLWNRPVQVPPNAGLEKGVQALAEGDASLDFLRECRLKAVLYEVMALCLAAVPPETRRRGEWLAAEMEPILPALRHIDAHLADPLPVARLAACCHLSADTFARCFRRCVGQTPTQYVQECRVTQAAQRLLFTGDSIERIADDCGFGNRFYFSRIFTRHTGLSPAAYRISGQIGT